MTLVFRKKNDVYLEVIEGERSEERMLLDYFTFEIENAKFHPAVKNKYWDGRIRLYDGTKKTIYAGLTHDIIKFSQLMDVDVEFEGTQYDFPGREQPLDDEFAEGFLKALDPHSRGKPIEMRDYQIDAFKHALRKQRCLLLSPTASGKSLIIYSLMRWWREINDRKILIIVPTIGLVSQMIADFQDYSNGSFNDVQGIQGGTSKEVTASVVCATWQSIYKQPLSWFAQFGSVVVDEVHTAQAKSLKGIMEKLLVCPDRVGLTGTLQDTKCVSKNSMVETINGKKQITEIEIGDQVLSLNNETNEFEFKEVVRKMNNGFKEKLLRIETENGIIEITSDHEVLTQRGWVKGEDLNENDSIMLGEIK